MATILARRKNYKMILIADEICHDVTISLKARGLVLTAIAYAEEEFDLQTLVRLSTDKRDSVASALKELLAAGYVQKQKHPSPNQHEYYRWVISDRKHRKKEPPPPLKNVCIAVAKTPQKLLWITLLSLRKIRSPLRKIRSLPRGTLFMILII